MTVQELIEQLQKITDKSMQVHMYYDGAPRLSCNGAFINEHETFYDETENYDEHCEARDILVLCQTDDVYNGYKSCSWVFKEES